MPTPPPTLHRQRTCRACGKKYDYPVKGIAATRHHCEDCVAVPPETRKILERLNSRVTQLERQLASQPRRQEVKPATPTM
jgi:predicted aldo/keto reductase-like oxidoreductase